MFVRRTGADSRVGAQSFPLSALFLFKSQHVDHLCLEGHKQQNGHDVVLVISCQHPSGVMDIIHNKESMSAINQHNREVLDNKSTEVKDIFAIDTSTTRITRLAWRSSL